MSIPRLQEVQISLSRREEELNRDKQLQIKQKERENKALYDSMDQKNLVQFSRPEHFLAWYQSVDQMDKSIPGGFETEEEAEQQEVEENGFRASPNKRYEPES